MNWSDAAIKNDRIAELVRRVDCQALSRAGLRQQANLAWTTWTKIIPICVDLLLDQEVYVCATRISRRSSLGKEITSPRSISGRFIKIDMMACDDFKTQPNRFDRTTQRSTIQGEKGKRFLSKDEREKEIVIIITVVLFTWVAQALVITFWGVICWCGYMHMSINEEYAPIFFCRHRVCSVTARGVRSLGWRRTRQKPLLTAQGEGPIWGANLRNTLRLRSFAVQTVTSNLVNNESNHLLNRFLPTWREKSIHTQACSRRYEWFLKG